MEQYRVSDTMMIKKQLQREAQDALQQGNYALAARNWVDGHCLPEDEGALAALFNRVNDLNEAFPDPDLCAILGLIALDFNSVFTADREDALIQCVYWSKTGLQVNPDHYLCSRHAGSALYWLGDYEAALKYYEKAAQIKVSPVLEIRIFNILNRQVELPDFSKLQIDMHTNSAMEAYNAGVELSYILESDRISSSNESERLLQLKIDLYERSYSLYRAAIFDGNGDVINCDARTFSMCCHNLALELKDIDRSIAITTEGIESYPVMDMLQNRMTLYQDAGYYDLLIKEGERILDAYVDDMDLETYFCTLDSLCMAHLELKQYQAALEYVTLGLEVIKDVNDVEGIWESEDIVRCYTNFYIHKAQAEAALGIVTTVEEAAETAEQILAEMPDNHSVLISRANIFIEEGYFGQAMECYQYALKLGLEREESRTVQVAFYNMGYLQTVHLGNHQAAILSFEQSMEADNTDFWCYYWVLHCAYHLEDNHKTIQYAKLAIEALEKQEGVAESIIAEIYEHMGVAQIDLEQYDKAVVTLELALSYQATELIRENLKIAKAHVNSSEGFFKKLFGK